MAFSSPAAQKEAPVAAGSWGWLARAALIAGAYGLASTAWIWFSRRTLPWFAPDQQALLRWSVETGIGFILVTTGLLFLVLARAFYTLKQTTTALAEKERARIEQQLDAERLARLYAALGHLNQAIAWSRNRADLVRKVCGVLVEQGGFKLAWLGWHDATTQRITPAAQAGAPREYLETVVVYGDERAGGFAPAGSAFRSGHVVTCNDVVHDSASPAQRAAAVQHGIGSGAFFPIRVNGTVVGLLAIYTTEPQWFRGNEMALLTEAAMDVSLGLDRLALLEERTAAEGQARREEAFSRMMIESLPGIVYFYNAEGQFLRWNKTFEQVSGYTAQEVGRMHPREFFDAADGPLVESRIAEVFTRGVSSVEAPFRTRDGSKIPYYFTGRRVEFDGMTCLVGVGIDISERRRAEEALERSERRHRTTLDSILEGCQLLGFDWTYLYLNDAASRHNRRPNAELLGRRLQDCWPGIEDTAVFKLLRRSLEARLPVHEEVEFAFPDGARGWFDFRAQPAPEGVFILSIDITERKHAEAELQEVERRFESVVESLQEGLVITDATGDLLYWNPSALRLLGFDDPEEGRRQQQRFNELFELTTLEGVVLPSPQWPLARARRGDTFERLPLRVRRRDRSWERVLSYTGVNLRRPDNRVLAFVTLHDITAQTVAEAERARLFEQEKAARLEAEKAREQVDHILGSVTDAFVALDRNWRYAYVNDRAARIFGRQREDLIGKHIWTEFPEGIGQPFQKAYERAMREKVEIQFEEYHAPDDAWFENRIYPSPEGISIVFQDISARKRAERLLREANEKLEARVAERTAELKAALLRAEAADRIKSAFLATMSHELRTPLNSIIGFTGIVLQGLAGPLNDEQAKQLGMVRGSARHLLELINDVLDLSKIEAGQLEVRKERFSLGDAVERVIASVRPMAAKKGLRLGASVSPEIGIVESDRRRVEQILLNLVNNAVKFTEQGEVSVTAALGNDRRLEPVGAPRRVVELAVADTGIGIKAEDLTSLFQPFRQVDSGLARHHEGTGLGLAICQRLATLLDGRIVAQSEWGKGSVFTVILPI